MTRIAQRVFEEDGKLVVHTQHDFSDVLNEVKQIREAGIESPVAMSDSKLVGRIPMDLLTKWIKEAGLQWSDTEAVRDLIRSKMLSGEFDDFRVWMGTY